MLWFANWIGCFKMLKNFNVIVDFWPWNSTNAKVFMYLSVVSIFMYLFDNNVTTILLISATSYYSLVSKAIGETYMCVILTRSQVTWLSLIFLIVLIQSKCVAFVATFVASLIQQVVERERRGKRHRREYIQSGNVTAIMLIHSCVSLYCNCTALPWCWHPGYAYNIQWCFLTVAR